VFIADARRNGSYLRTTWHADGRMFVVSIWNEEVCLGAVRVPVEDAAEIVSLLMDGLIEVVASGPAATLGPAPGPGGRRRSAWDEFRAPAAGVGPPRRDQGRRHQAPAPHHRAAPPGAGAAGLAPQRLTPG
jgi:hypothetical protein